MHQRYNLKVGIGKIGKVVTNTARQTFLHKDHLPFVFVIYATQSVGSVPWWAAKVLQVGPDLESRLNQIKILK